MAHVTAKFHKYQQIVHATPSRFKVVVAGRRWGKCTRKDEQIQMANGSLKSVQDVLPGDLIVTVNEDTYKLEVKPVKHVHDNGVRETLKVTTRSGRSLTITPNHPLLVHNRWTETKDIVVGDLVAVPRATPFGSDPMPAHEIDFLAVWLAEGDSNGYTNETPQIVSVMNDAAAVIGIEFVDAAYGLVRRGLRWRWRGIERNKNGALDLLRKYHLKGTNAKTKTIPEEIFRLPEAQLARFLNLFVACDGSINHRSKGTWAVEIGLANEPMVRQIVSLFHKFGIQGNVSKKVHKAKSSVTGENFISWRFIFSDSKSLITFCERIGAVGKEHVVEQALVSAKNSAGSCNSYLPISHDEFVKHLVYEPDTTKGRYGGYNCKVARDLPNELRVGLNSWRKQTPSRISERRYKNLRGYSDGFFDPIADGGLVWDEVMSITPAGKHQTYDLTVEGNHNFIANGFITHNTAYAMIELVLAALRNKNALIWYVAPTYAMAHDIMWGPLCAMIPRVFMSKKPNDTKMTITLKNGTIIQCKGADKPDSLRGRGVNLIVADEYQDFKDDVWGQVLFPTLTDRRGSAIIIGTPKAYNHLYELYQKGQSTDPEDKDWASWQFPTATSPFIPAAELAAARRNSDERTFRQEFEASFENMSGRVYYPFDRAVHVGDYPFDPMNYIIVGQDFNVDPMSSVILQMKGKNELWAVDEIVLSQSNTQETVDEIERRYFRLFPNRVAVFPDPAGGNRSSARGESDIQIFREKGVNRLIYHKKHPMVADRVNAVNSMLKAADGSVRLRIDKRCKHLIAALEQTIYKPNSREVDKSQGTEHSADALGYPIEYLFPLRKIALISASR